MSTNPSYNYLLKSKEEKSTTEPESQTRLTLNNPSYNYLTNTSQISTSPTKPATGGSSFNYLMDTSNITTTKETLQDLRDDKEFQERSLNFLSSLDEGETVDDVFGYFRGADYNIADTTKTYFQSEKFTEEQKQDYAYLRDRFDNAEIGGFVEGLKATADIGSEIISDPTILASVFFVPWTGGQSLTARIATGKAAQEGLKKLTSAKVAKTVAEGVKKVPFQSLPQKLSKNAVATVAATEGFLWGSTNNYLNQNIDVTVGRREEVSPVESLAIGAVTASIPFALRGTGAGVTKFKNSVADSRAARIEGEADYKGSVFDIGVEKYDEIIDGILPNYRRLSGFVNKPTSRFIEKMKEDENLAKLIKLFRYDASKQLFGKDAVDSLEMSERSFYEYLNNAVGKRSEELDEILFPLYEKTKRQVPKFGSRDAFISLSSQRAERESFFNTQGISDNLNNALVYVMRSGMKKAGNIVVDGKKVSLKKAFSLTDEQYKQVFPTVTKLNKFFSSIRDEAIGEGINLGKIENYLPRSWSHAALKQELKNLDRGIEGTLVKEIKLKEKLNTKQVKKLLGEMLDPNKRRLNPFDEIPESVLKGKGKSPAFVKARELRNIDDSILSDYLDNSLENLTRDYTTQSAAYIQRTKHLGKDIKAFRKKHLNNIDNLTESEKTGLENIYRTMTGQYEPVGPESIRKVGRAIGNFSVVVNQLALLPLATITSFSEIAVPMLRGVATGDIKKGQGVVQIAETINEYRKFWWNDIVSKDMADARPEALKELNRFNRAMRGAAEDRSLAMYGEAFGPRAMKAQNKFFKINLLHDWTKFVQLVSFKVGKSKIYDNLDILANTKNLTSKKKLRLENQLSELGVDIAEGLKWVKSGGQPTGTFYNESLLPSAARYVDEVIMNPTAAANQKPIWHSMPSTRWAFGLMGFPTAFSNTVIKNAVREVSLDVRTGQREAIPSVMAGITTMTGIAMFGNTLRSGGDNLDRLANGETELSQEFWDGVIRTGLFSMTGENLYRTVKGTEYDNFARSITQRFTGPAVDDIFRFFDDYVGPLAWAVDEFPGITAIRSADKELYDAIKKGAREYDKEHGWVATGKKVEDNGIKLSTPTKPLSTSREGFAEGLEVNVPYTKDEPEERINPFTGEPYTAIYKRRVDYVDGGGVKLFGEDGLIFDHTNPLDYLMAIPGLGLLGVGAKVTSKFKVADKLRMASRQKKLPKTQYHGGYSSVEKGQATSTGFYTTPQFSYADAFSRPEFRNFKDRGTPGLYKLDLSKAKNIELTDKPTKGLQKTIDAKLEQLTKKGTTKDKLQKKFGLKGSFSPRNLSKKDERLYNGLGWLFGKNKTISGGAPKYRMEETLNFLRKEGVEILTDSKVLKAGAKGKGAEAEYFLIKDFPKKKLTEEEIEKLRKLLIQKGSYAEGGVVLSNEQTEFIQLALDVHQEQED